MKTTVAVFFGGRSTEHEISVISAIQTINSINKAKYNPIPVYISKEGRWYTGDTLLDLKNYRDPKVLLANCEEVYMRTTFGDRNLYALKPSGLFNKTKIISTIDIVFPVLHGSNGEDGVFQGVIENIGIPYIGCDVLSSAIGMDKIFMKMILQQCNIPVVPYVWFTDKQWFVDEETIVKEIEDSFGYPVMVKPANLGSSVGINKASDLKQLKEKILEASKYSQRIIVEKMIVDMQEINCSILGDSNDCRASVLEEPIKTGELLSYEDKYMGGTSGSKGMAHSSKRIPAPLDPKQTSNIQELAMRTFKVLGCSGVSRVDVMIDKQDGAVYVNEINTIPGSLSYYLWEFTGIEFTELIESLISIALQRNRERESKITSYSINIFNSSTLTGTKGGIKSGKLK